MMLQIYSTVQPNGFVGFSAGFTAPAFAHAAAAFAARRQFVSTGNIPLWVGSTAVTRPSSQSHNPAMKEAGFSAAMIVMAAFLPVVAVAVAMWTVRKFSVQAELGERFSTSELSCRIGIAPYSKGGIVVGPNLWQDRRSDGGRPLAQIPRPSDRAAIANYARIRFDASGGA